MSKIYCLKKELENLDKLGGRDLALVYANPIIGSYRKGIDAHEARSAYMEWVSEKLCAIHDAIQTYLKKSAIDYPYPYNQQLRGTHDGAYKMAVAEKEIVRGIMNYQKLGGRVVNYAKGAKFLPQIIDYEVPMFCLKEGNVSSRKIDAVGRAIGAQRDRLYIYEAKKNNSDETLLRCLMEAFSYSLFVDRVRFKESLYSSSEREKSLKMSDAEPAVWPDDVGSKSQLSRTKQKDLTGGEPTGLKRSIIIKKNAVNLFIFPR